MHLALTLSQDLRQKMTLEKHFGSDSVLPRVAVMMRTKEFSRCMSIIKRLAPVMEYRCKVDHVLAAFVPTAIQQIQSFYKDEGKALRELYSEEHVTRLDATLEKALVQTRQIYWVAYQAAKSSGITLDEALDTLVKELKFTAIPVE